MSTPASSLPSMAATVREVIAGRARLSALYSDNELERIHVVRSGLPARTVRVLSADLDLPFEAVYGLLGVTRATTARLSKSGKNLNPSATERALFIAGLVKAVEGMIPADAAGAAAFDASKWVAQWLEEPQPALGGATPGSFMDTADGRRIVRNLLGQMEAGSYA